MFGIISYGTYIPKNRISLDDIASAWGKDPGEIQKGLRVREKAVADIDEDTVTLAIEASIDALAGYAGTAGDIEAILIGSESHPYAVNPTSSIVGEFLGVGNKYFASDLEFACKAGTAAATLIAGLVQAKAVKLGLAIGADTAQSRPHDALEYTSGAGAVALLIGDEKVAVELVANTSITSDTPDFWRRDGIAYPSHAGRFSGEPAYFSHVVGATEKILQMTNRKPADIDYCVFHMPNGKFPREVSKRLGFTKEQLGPSLTVDHIGNPYSASSLLGLAAVLDAALPGQTICMTSYGSGAGSDAFIWRTTEHIVEVQKNRKKRGTTIADQIKNKAYIDYVSYLRSTHKI